MPEKTNLNAKQKQEIKQQVAVQTTKIEEKLEKQAGKIIEKEVKHEVKEIEQKVEEELKKKFSDRLKQGATLFNKELKNQIATAITASFAFLIALSWRTPIQNSVNNFIENLHLTGKAIYIEYISAIVITLIAVIFIMLFSKWQSKK